MNVEDGNSPIIFANAAIVDGSSDIPHEGMHVLAEAGVIREVSDRPIRASAARTVDLAGKTLMPGLIDAHVHVLATTPKLGENGMLPNTLVLARAFRLMQAMLMRGFTTVRDAAGADYGLKQAAEEGLVLSPRLVICGKCLSQTGGHGDHRGRYDTRSAEFYLTRIGAFGRICNGVSEVRRAAREELKAGADFIKIAANGGIASPTDPITQIQYSRDEVAAVVEEAANAQTYVAAHVYSDEAIRHVVECGVQSIEHCNLVSESTAALMAGRGAIACPTLVAFEVLNDHGAQHGITEEALEKVNAVRANGLRSLEILRNTGVTMAYGSDLGGWMQPYQSDEFTIRGRVLPAHEVIRAATVNAAKLLRREGEIGCIVPGARADLIVVDGNPLKDLSLLGGQGRHMPAIMQGGGFVKNEIN
jgi:imidazolonepropionase-like amidohydrolase